MAKEQSEQARSEPFEFWRFAYLVEVTDFRAVSLGQLLATITLVPGPSIFYHLHQRFRQHPERLPDYPNDFAEWTNDVLGNAVVAERLANLNLARSASIEAVRREISMILAGEADESREQRVTADKAFIFCRARMVVFPAGERASDPEQLARILRTIPNDSISYHLFTAKLLRGGRTNDFAAWLERQGYRRLAELVEAFDPYLNSLDDNRSYLVECIERCLDASREEQDRA